MQDRHCKVSLRHLGHDHYQTSRRVAATTTPYQVRVSTFTGEPRQGSSYVNVLFFIIGIFCFDFGFLWTQTAFHSEFRRNAPCVSRLWGESAPAICTLLQRGHCPIHMVYQILNVTRGNEEGENTCYIAAYEHPRLGDFLCDVRFRIDRSSHTARMLLE